MLIWYIFIEEALFVLCPITYILAKALAEGVIENKGYQTRAEPFFAAKLNKRAVSITWKKEWLHKPVFRKTVRTEKSEMKIGRELNTARKALRAAGGAVEEERQAFNNGRRGLWKKLDDA